MKAKDRVRAHTDDAVNQKIEARTERRVLQAANANERTISRRIEELEEEWDMERYLETNASALAFSGVVLGFLVNKKFLAIPAIVLPFLFQHAVQGWCPPIPLLRRLGVRTRKEIDAEKYALKAVRGDFDNLPIANNGDSVRRARQAWEAAKT
ncbi:MAG TPA: hypothetical protein VH170_05055 [Chthoniobacterales bacterium]|jgi:hypothetical protein|nr:hypothetical protein [Chthoniobacterales bacterium]